MLMSRVPCCLMKCVSLTFHVVCCKFVTATILNSNIVFVQTMVEHTSCSVTEKRVIMLVQRMLRTRSCAS